MKLPDITFQRGAPELQTGAPRQAEASERRAGLAFKAAGDTAQVALDMAARAAEAEAKTDAGRRVSRMKLEALEMRQEVQQRYLDDPNLPMEDYLEEVRSGDESIMEQNSQGASNRVTQLTEPFTQSVRAGRYYAEDINFFTDTSNARAGMALAEMTTTYQRMAQQRPDLVDEYLDAFKDTIETLGYSDKQRERLAYQEVAGTIYKAGLAGILEQGYEALPAASAYVNRGFAEGLVTVDEKVRFDDVISENAAEYISTSNQTRRNQLFNNPDPAAYEAAVKATEVAIDAFAPLTSLDKDDLYRSEIEAMTLTYLNGLARFGDLTLLKETLESGDLDERIDPAAGWKIYDAGARAREEKISLNAADVIKDAGNLSNSIAGGMILNEDKLLEMVVRIDGLIENEFVSPSQRATLRSRREDLMVYVDGANATGGVRGDLLPEESVRAKISSSKTWAQNQNRYDYDVSSKYYDSVNNYNTKMLSRRVEDPAAAVMAEGDQNTIDAFDSAMELTAQLVTDRSLDPEQRAQLLADARQRWSIYANRTKAVQAQIFNTPASKQAYFSAETMPLFRQLEDHLNEGTPSDQLNALRDVALMFGEDMYQEILAELAPENIAIAGAGAALRILRPEIAEDILTGADRADAIAASQPVVDRQTLREAVAARTEYIREAAGSRADAVVDLVTYAYYGRARDKDLEELNTDMVENLLLEIQGPAIDLPGYRTFSYRETTQYGEVGKFVDPGEFIFRIKELANAPGLVDMTHEDVGDMYDAGGNYVNAGVVFGNAGLRLVPAGGNGKYFIEISNSVQNIFTGELHAGRINDENGNPWVLDMTRINFRDKPPFWGSRFDNAAMWLDTIRSGFE